MYRTTKIQYDTIYCTILFDIARAAISYCTVYRASGCASFCTILRKRLSIVLYDNSRAAIVLYDNARAAFMVRLSACHDGRRRCLRKDHRSSFEVAVVYGDAVGIAAIILASQRRREGSSRDNLRAVNRSLGAIDGARYNTPFERGMYDERCLTLNFCS